MFLKYIKPDLRNEIEKKINEWKEQNYFVVGSLIFFIALLTIEGLQVREGGGSDAVFLKTGYQTALDSCINKITEVTTFKTQSLNCNKGKRKCQVLFGF